MKHNLIRGLVLVLTVVAVVAAATLLTGPYLSATRGEEEQVAYNQFIQLVENDEVSHVAIYSGHLVGLKRDTKVQAEHFPDTYDFICDIPEQSVLNDDISNRVAKRDGLDAAQVTMADWNMVVDYEKDPEGSIWSLLLPNIIVIGLTGVMLFIFMRQLQGGNNKAMNFSKSRARLADDSPERKVTFADVAGAEEEKEEMMEIVEFLRNPKKFSDLGARIPKGVLLVGPPGTGKTYLARAVAGEAGVPFFSISGSDFVELYVGVGASRVRDLFDRAKRNAPCIVFIDEIDAVGRHRGAGMGGGHDEREQTLNQLLVEMDGFAVNEGIIIVAATNRPDILDPALLRPGRFDRNVTVGYPDAKGREAILKVHSRKKPLADDVDLTELARLTPWTTPADLENILNEAAILSARRNLKQIPMAVIEEAINRVEMGPEKRSHKVLQKDRELVAVHESGHALVAGLLPHCDPVKEVSIIARGQAGGYTMTRPDEEISYVTRSYLIDRLAMSMGGHVAEKVVLGDVSTGSSGDLQQASKTARRMITEYGMSEAIGPMYLAGEGEVFLGRDYGHMQNFSEALSARIDEEAKRLLTEAMETAERLIRENRTVLDALTAALLEREKITAEEFQILLKGGVLPPKEEAHAAQEPADEPRAEAPAAPQACEAPAPAEPCDAAEPADTEPNQ